MAELKRPVSPSIVALERKFAFKPVTSAELVNDLFNSHSEYAHGHRREKVRVPVHSTGIASVGEWITRADAHFTRSKVPVLHGRLLIVGLALEVGEIWEYLTKTGLLQAIHSEIKEPLEDLLTPEALGVWLRLTRLHTEFPDPTARSRTEAGVPPASPEPRNQTGRAQDAQDYPPAEYSGSLPPPDDDERPHPAPTGASPAQADAPADADDHGGHKGQAPTSALFADEEPSWGRDTAAMRDHSRHSPDAPVTQNVAPATPPRRKGEPSPAPAHSSSEETVPAHPDDPAVLDTLARRPFARCIANRMDEVWRGRDRRPTRRGEADTGSGGAFMLHLHGPWGSGKSSILNFLRDELQGEHRPRKEERWVVVEFNAWRHQRIRPPWWALIRDVYAQSARQLPPLKSLWLRVRWWAWRVRADWLPVAAAAVIITLAVLVITGVLDLFPEPVQTAPGTQAQRQADDAWKGVELALKLLTGALAAWGTVFAVSRSLAFGSARAAQAYTELKSDPLGPIVRLFQRLTARIGRPVAVFVDDLDRCDGKYVVELLEGIQTLFRTAPVTYVVAADRKWICASFQQGYKDFGDDIGEAGRPLGYLFLDKLFQVSASVPRPAPEVQRAYWAALLRAAGTADASALEARQREAEKQAEREVGDLKTTEELQAFVQAASDPLKQEGRRAVAAQRITTPEAQRETQKHLLEGFADLLEPNPRSMKRLVNAYGLHQATHFLEHRHVAPDALARWTLIELRWPLLADYLAARPEALTAIHDGSEPAGVPDALKPLFKDEAVGAVVRGGSAEALDEHTLRQIVGSVDARQPALSRAQKNSVDSADSA